MIAVDGIDERRRGKRENLWVTTRLMIQPECGKWADWRVTGRLNPSRETKFTGAHGDRERNIFLGDDFIIYSPGDV